MRFVRYTESTDPANALAIVQRAVVLFCKNDLTLNLFAAQCHERAGYFSEMRINSALDLLAMIRSAAYLMLHVNMHECKEHETFEL